MNWEYRALRTGGYPTEGDLNSLGRRGWELISVSFVDIPAWTMADGAWVSLFKKAVPPIPGVTRYYFDEPVVLTRDESLVVQSLQTHGGDYEIERFFIRREDGGLEEIGFYAEPDRGPLPSLFVEEDRDAGARTIIEHGLTGEEDVVE